MNVISVITILLIIIICRRLFLKYNVKTNPNTSIDIITKKYNLNNDSKKINNVYIFMSYDYDKFPEYGYYSIELMKKYCEKNGYSFLTLDHSGQKEISPYWLRVKDLVYLTHNILNEDDILLYFDLDSIINPDYHNWKIEKILNSLDVSTNNKWKMYVSMDPIEYMKDSFNTGIIIVRNKDWSRKFLQYWLDSYPSERWNYDSKSKRWNCNICIWAGDNYEQGSLSKIYDNNILNSKRNILPVDVSIFGNPNHMKKDAFTIHLMGVSNSTRVEILKEIYEKYINL